VGNLKKLVKKCAAKAVLFEIIFNEFRENGESMAEMDVEYEASPSHILQAIKDFREKTDEHIKSLRSDLQALAFGSFSALARQEI
jgi:hypothetical protein